MLSGLYIIIVNWNLKEDTLACLESLITAGASPKNVILIDNGSSDGSVQALRTQFDGMLQIIENAYNIGFASASNQGIQRAMDQGAEWIMLLNNDTLVAPDFFMEFERATSLVKSYDILAPLIFYQAAPGQIWALGDHLIPGTLITTNPYRGKEYNQALPAVIPVDFVTGCAMLVRRRVFEQIGLLDGSLIMYGEEVDFFWRARLAGFRLACVTKAKIWHKVSLSADRDKPRARYLRIRNQIYFYRKYARGFQRPIMFLFTVFRSLRIAMSDLLSKQAGLIPPLVKGWIDGWRN